MAERLRHAAGFLDGGSENPSLKNTLYRYDSKDCYVNQNGEPLINGDKYLNVYNDEGWRTEWRSIQSANDPARTYLANHDGFEADSINADGSEFVIGSTTYNIGEGMVLTPEPDSYTP